MKDKEILDLVSIQFCKKLIELVESAEYEFVVPKQLI